MTIETILGQKDADVATIEPEASVRKAADWLRVRNIGALVVTSGNAVLGVIPNVKLFTHFPATARLSHRCRERNQCDTA
jgi:hypothetical protein